MIEKIQTRRDNYRIDFHYYNCARDAMYDVVSKLVNKGYSDIYIPGYIGWSPKEGSGIFDPLNRILDLRRHYYRITKELWVNMEDLQENLYHHSLLLVVNYFGFRDKKIKELITIAHQRDCVVIEDNAHGFYTYFCKGSIGADVSFFSLHKMFPFSQGGGLVIENQKLDISGLDDLENNAMWNPFIYNIHEIARVRTNHFRTYGRMMADKTRWFEPLRNLSDLEANVPQTFPIIIKCNNRDRIYEIMNAQGYGVVSLYHTMIGELRNNKHEDANWLSKHILNLPLHQDVDEKEIFNLVEALEEACVAVESK